eukprot:scaffold347_cov239-Pinguiococcus_pyrenoidosus.AAC.30
MGCSCELRIEEARRRVSDRSPQFGGPKLKCCKISEGQKALRAHVKLAAAASSSLRGGNSRREGFGNLPMVAPSAPLDNAFLSAADPVVQSFGGSLGSSMPLGKRKYLSQFLILALLQSPPPPASALHIHQNTNILLTSASNHPSQNLLQPLSAVALAVATAAESKQYQNVLVPSVAALSPIRSSSQTAAKGPLAAPGRLRMAGPGPRLLLVDQPDAVAAFLMNVLPFQPATLPPGARPARQTWLLLEDQRGEDQGGAQVLLLQRGSEQAAFYGLDPGLHGPNVLLYSTADTEFLRTKAIAAAWPTR